MKTEDHPPTFWFMPVSIFGMFGMTRFITDSHLFALLPSLAPEPHDACSFASSSQIWLLPKGTGFIVGMASHNAVASDARILEATASGMAGSIMVF